MKELKTLKDLETHAECNTCHNHVIFIDELKAEAVKWIKEDIEYMGCIGDSFKDLELMQPRIMKWIKFFNITEEDLK